MIFAVPLGYLYYLTLRDEAGQGPQLVGRMFARGSVYGVVVSLLLLLVRRIWDPSQHGAGLFWYLALHDYWLPVLFLTLLFMLTGSVRDMPPSERRTALVSCYGGAFTLFGVLDLFIRAEYQGIYELFHLPALRLAVMVAVPLFYALFAEETFWTRYLYLVAMSALPLLPGLIGLLSMAGYGVLSLVVTPVILAAAYAGSVFVGGSSRSAAFW